MNRRDFLRLTAYASSLVLAGRLPLLSADRQQSRPRLQQRAARRTSATPQNIFTEPPAIEPVTGYLGKFRPVAAGSMRGDFTAKYDLIKWGAINNQTGRPRNRISGSLEIVRKVNGRNTVYESVENRTGQTTSKVTASLNCRGKLDAALRWTAVSDVMNGRLAQPDLSFEEQGLVDNGNIVRTNKLGTVKSVNSHTLIPHEALLALLAGDTVKSGDLHFDMLQNGLVIKPNQTLHYSGRIQIPVAHRNAAMDCYVQTGYGILPTHYLVDGHGRMQLITQENTNWALKELS
ncbi:MAG: hypothetical protein ACYSTT_03585 [Planctomycetota bacterium]|jgi:hypothetical protein